MDHSEWENRAAHVLMHSDVITKLKEGGKKGRKHSDFLRSLA